LIRKAFDVSVEAHKEQRRKSGEAYIFHPIAVAKIVASERGLVPLLLPQHYYMMLWKTLPTVKDIERIFKSGATCRRIN
jgi:GTP pyrophosphokinase